MAGNYNQHWCSILLYYNDDNDDVLQYFDKNVCRI